MHTAMGKTLRGLERIFRRVSRNDSRRATQILVLEYQLPLGCCVHLTPMFEALKVCRPELRIAVATRGLGAEVLRHSPFVDDIVVTANPLTDLVQAVRDLRIGLNARGLNPDCVLTGVADQRTRISLLGLLSSSGWRGGFTQMASMYQRPLIADDSLSHIGNNLQLARLLGCESRAVEPRVFFSAKEATGVEQLLQEANPEGRPVVAMITQTSGGQRTGWRTAQFVAVIEAVMERGYSIVYLGTAADRPAIQSICNAAGGAGYSLAGRTTVPELAAVLAKSDAAISLDTGTMHVGRAVGVPMVVLGPSWQKPLEWMPLGVTNVRILRGEDRAVIPDGYQLDEIDAVSVVTAFDELMAQYPPSGEALRHRVSCSLSEADHLATAG